MALETTVHPVEIGTRTLSLHKVCGTDAASLQSILGSLTETSGMHLPGPLPSSIDSTHFATMKQRSAYWLAEKTDGVRFVYMACEFKSLSIGCIFDRTMTPYLAWMTEMPRPFVQGTVVDGEVVFDASADRWVFLVFDAVVVSGVPVKTFPFSRRLECFRMAMWCYAYDPLDPMEFRIKTFIKMSPTVLAEYQDHVTNEVQGKYAIDGHVFVPEDDPVVYGRHDAMFKLKTHHTVDFLVKNGKLCVYDDKNRRNKVVGEPGGQHKHLATEGKIVECELVGSQWHVLSVRQDKSRPNTKFVYDKTMLNMRENLQVADVVAVLFGE